MQIPFSIVLCVQSGIYMTMNANIHTYIHTKRIKTHMHTRTFAFSRVRCTTSPQLQTVRLSYNGCAMCACTFEINKLCSVFSACAPPFGLRPQQLRMRMPSPLPFRSFQAVCSGACVFVCVCVGSFTIDWARRRRLPRDSVRSHVAHQQHTHAHSQLSRIESLKHNHASHDVDKRRSLLHMNTACIRRYLPHARNLIYGSKRTMFGTSPTLVPSPYPWWACIRSWSWSCEIACTWMRVLFVGRSRHASWARKRA